MEAALTGKVFAGLSLQGSIRGVRDVSGTQWLVPAHTTLSGHQATLKVDLGAPSTSWDASPGSCVRA